MKKRVLLVEDNPAAMDVMQKELEFLGYEVLLAIDGEEALRLAGAESPDVIVMDILMPKMDGLEAASKLRADPTTKDIPILAATAKAMPGDRDQCLASGCDEYLAKPFTHKELDAVIKQLLGGS
jgi:CheY-like chemotaxis protein